MPSIADLYVEIMPSTARLADGIVRAFREVDPKAAEAGRRWGQEIQRGIGQTKVELTADTAKAKAQIDDAAKDKKSTVEVDADTAKAEAQIDVAARDRKATIEVDADTLVSSAQRSFSQLAPTFAGAGTQLSQSLSSSGASAATSVGGSLSGVMGPVGTALTAALVGGAVAAAAGVAAALSGVIGLIPAGLGGGLGVLGTLVTGLDGVKDAWDAAGKAADSATKDQAEKAKSVASAQKTLRDAVLDESSAQKDVANARKDARQQLEDLNVQMRGGVIDEKQAILDAQAARRDLATGRFRDSIEYEQAQLRVQQADQRVLESHERNVHLQDRASEANQKGVEGSDQVVSAQQRLMKAHENTALALQNLAAAQSKTSSNADAFALAMGKLSPNAQQFMNTLLGLKPAWEKLKFSVQDSLFAGLGPELQKLATQYMPVLQQMMTSLAGTMNTAFKDIGAWLSKPETMASIQAIVANIGSSFQIWSKSLVPFSQAFLTITQVGSGFLPGLGQMITNIANSFNNFIQNAAKSGQLKQWMETGITALREFINLFPILGKMFIDLAPLGVPILRMLAGLVYGLEPVTRAIGGAVNIATSLNQKFGSWVREMWPPLHEMLQNMERVFSRVFDTISKIIEKAWHFIKPILDVFKRTLGGLDPTGMLGKLGSLVSGKLGDVFNNNSGPGGGGGSPGGMSSPTFGGGNGVPSWLDKNSGQRYWWKSDPTSPGGGAPTWLDPNSGQRFWWQGSGMPSASAVPPPSAMPNMGAAAPSGVLVTPENLQQAYQVAMGASGQPYGYGGIGDSAHGGLYDCSGFMSTLYGVLTGKAMPGQMRFFTTESDLTKLGFIPTNTPVPGTFQVGIHHGGGGPNSHMAGTMPNGVNVESGGNGTLYGGKAAGAWDNQFETHYYLPGSPDMSGMYPSAAGMPTIANPQGVSPEGVPLGTQNQPYYVMPAQQGNSSAEQFGQSMLDGILEIFGLDGSVFPNPFGGGLFKGFKGLMSFFTGQAKNRQGLPASAYGTDGASLGSPMGMTPGGGDALGGALGMLSGIVPKPFGQLDRGGPATAPDQFDPFVPGSGGKTALPSSFTPAQNQMQAGAYQPNQSINFYGPVGNPQDAGNMAKDLNIPRARQGLTGIPGG